MGIKTTQNFALIWNLQRKDAKTLLTEKLQAKEVCKVEVCPLLIVLTCKKILAKNCRMQFRKKWLNQLKDLSIKHCKEYYLESFACESHQVVKIAVP